MQDRDKLKRRIELGEELWDLFVADLISLLKEGNLTSADRAVIRKVVTDAGYTLDPRQLPESLQSKLTSLVEFDDELDEPPF